MRRGFLGKIRLYLIISYIESPYFRLKTVDNFKIFGNSAVASKIQIFFLSIKPIQSRFFKDFF